MRNNSTENTNVYEEVKSMPSPESNGYVIRDQFNRYVDGGSIFIVFNEDNQTLEWWLTTFTTEVGSIYKYSSKERAEKILLLLNKLKVIAGFVDTEFHVEEYTRENFTQSEMSVYAILVPVGKKTLHKRLMRDIRKQYLN